MKYIIKIGLGLFSLIAITLFMMNGTMQSSSNAQVSNKRVPTSDTEVKLSYAPVVREAAPAVVNIYTKRVVRTRTSPFLNDPFFSRFFGGSSAPRERIERSLGSGVIVREEGVVITNHHVIDGADEITVALSDRREFEAEVILMDESTDLAVLRIEPSGEPLTILEFSNSDDVEVGDLVLAIGNPFGVGQSVTSGIVSALARTQVGDDAYQFFIQTDAAVNPGNSGGALVGMDGKLVGINTSIYSRSGGSNGIGFAIPVKMVDFVLNAALNDGEIIRPWFGATGQAVSSEIAESLGFDRPGGVLVDNVYPDSPADRGGLEPGDVILSIDGEEIFDTQGLRYFIGLGRIGGETVLEVLKGDDSRTLTIELEAAPEDPPRNITTLDGDHIFENVEVGNLSPAFSSELGINLFEKGVIILDIPRSSPVRRLNVLRPGDIFDRIDNEDIDTVEGLEDALDDAESDISFAVRRNGRLIECQARGRNSYSCR
ncbi:Do family serine endopeptidase [Pseudemcibacter aquimaris]|uniref:Do family serine endopeptidase n=1 Tax=Pseudemcibacter aquimaris TaxID=2857064 RepID=UPI002011B5D4|nr:Do family serine endopeptidase [Pseudemcibacter aquimaris]MCC3860452.1 Do family serine endopeptidase [Pseudemcibacter aquimaris]WDU59277.1 Do family serine endopeptidase [Pseudemcibacter aquimaris]